MAVAQGYGKTVTSGSVFAFDTGDTRNSYTGRPTVNVSAGLGLNNYNNVPGNVSTSITTTGGTYKGAAIYQQTITPLDATGVSYLTNGNNPGIGVYHGGGGGTGGQYSGHTIFFKPIGPMYSAPIYTHYSNITGWQSTSNYEDMGDGWFRAKVLWYNASTLSDNKFWAINPSGATANVPITVYWAGPFKENLNSTTISQFVEGTRSATQGLLPLVGNSTIDLTNVSFDSNAQMTFDGTNDYAVTTNMPAMSNWTAEVVINLSNYTTAQKIILDAHLGIRVETSNGYFNSHFGNGSGWVYTNLPSTFTYTANTPYHIVIAVESGGQARMYINGILDNSGNIGSGTTPTVPLYIGRYSQSPGYEITGVVPVVKIYNRALSAGEVRQNYLHYKTRFNLS